MVMIFFQPVDMVIQRIKTSCSHIAGLPHAASKNLPDPSGFADKVAAAHQYAADGTTQTFIETNADAVKEGAVDICRLLPGNKRIEEPSAIEVQQELLFIADLSDAADLFYIVAASTTTVGCIFEANKTGACTVNIVRVDGRQDLLCRDPSQFAFQCAYLCSGIEAMPPPS